MFLACYLLHLYLLLLASKVDDDEMPPKTPLDPRTFPRPPALEKIGRHLQIIWEGQTIADTKDAYWVLETTHAPTYYLPPSSVTLPLTKSTRSTHCEWKGAATYWNAAPPSSSGPRGAAPVVENRIWSYAAPTPGFAPIRDYLSFYAGPWDCYVDGERVQPQPGDFYGGWLTADIVGRVKGGPGTWGW